MARRRYIGVAAIAAFTVASGVLMTALELARRDLMTFVTDPATTAGLPPWTGFFSTLGIIGWSASAGACVVAAAVLARRPDDRYALFLATAALLAYLALDDAYLVHEYLAPEYLGVPQKAVILLICVATLTWAWRFRRELAGPHVELLALAGVMFAVSVTLDQTGGATLQQLVEEWLKLSGIAALTVWCFSAAVSALEAPRPRAASHRDVPVLPHRSARERPHAHEGRLSEI